LKQIKLLHFKKKEASFKIFLKTHKSSKDSRKIYKEGATQKIMVGEKKAARTFIGKLVVTKEGKKLGIIKDLTFETRSGELIHIVLGNATPYAASLNLEAGKSGELLIPFSSIISMGDFVIVDEDSLH